MFRKALCLISAAILLFTFNTAARESTDIERTTIWNPPSPGPLNTWSAPLLKAKELVIQPYFLYYRARGIFNDKGSYKSYTGGEKAHQYVGDLILYYGITDKLEIDLEGFYYWNYKELAPNVNANDGGFGDSYAYARYCLVEEAVEKPWMPCITAIAQMKFPIGTYQKLSPEKLGTDMTGTGSYDQGYGVILTKKIRPFILHADFIYNIPIETTIDEVKTGYANYINCDCAMEYILPKGFNLMIEANYLQQGDQRRGGELVPDTDSSSLLLVPGIGWSCEKVKALLCYQRTIAGTNTNVNDSFAFTLVYTF